MNPKQTVIREDMERIAQDRQIPWEQMNRKRILVTGATGLIGSTVIRALLHRNRKYGDQIHIIAMARDRAKAESCFAVKNDDLEILIGNVVTMPEISGPVDYIIHGACPTDSSFFQNRPVDTIDAILAGTKNILELAREKDSAGVVFLSSMEVYGKVEQEILLGEDLLWNLDLMSPRSSYPMAKRMAEHLCCSYAAQYGVNAMICRLAQTFGPGVRADDKRIFAYLARCVLSGKNIELATSGAKKNMYLYTADAVTAILTILLRGQSGEIYNAANPETYCSVKEMAQAVAEEFGNGEISVKTNVGSGGTAKYPPDTFLKLDIRKLQELGWRPAVDLMGMYGRMLSAL